MANMTSMEIFLRLLTTIIGVSIGVFISNSIFRLLDRRREEKLLASRKERASIMKRNSELYQELSGKE